MGPVFYMLNELLNLKSGINLIYGEGGTGKTTLALMLARDFSKFNKVIFIDTENGFNFERFKQISQEHYESCLRNILLIKARDFDEQCRVINNLENTKKVSLIVIDTIGSNYRVELKNNVKEVNKKMGDILAKLRLLSKSGINILITNQVYNFNNEIKSVGGEMVKKFCKFILKLEKNPRKMTIEKPNKFEYSFDIKNEGIILS